MNLNNEAKITPSNAKIDVPKPGFDLLLPPMNEQGNALIVQCCQNAGNRESSK